MHPSQRLVNHIALVIDASASMIDHTDVVSAADAQIQQLALRSEELGQETRVTVYVFNQVVTPLIFDMDVMRLPSIESLWRPSGMTALVDATIKSQQDLATTSQIYGDHAFLTFVLTDGMENASRTSWTRLRDVVDNGKSNWHVGFLVPDDAGVNYLLRAGVPRGNITVWDAAGLHGINESFSAIAESTERFMVNRSAGVAYTGVFDTSAKAVNSSTVGSLDEIKHARRFQATRDDRIDQFVRTATGNQYVIGSAFYELTKTETIQPTKQVLIVEKRTGKVFGGPEARRLIGLTGDKVRVKPTANPDYKIFVQSTSLNRKILRGTEVVVVPQ